MPRKDSHRTDALLEALPYIQKFRGATFVIKYGGSALEDEDNVDRLLRDVVFLEAVGINPILIHGGGKSITKKMRKAGLNARFVNGLRITNQASIEIVEEVLDQEINPHIVNKITEYGGKAHGMSGRSVFTAVKMPKQMEGGVEVDLEFVGTVSDVKLDEIEKLVGEECVPVISPIAQTEDGITLNVNADIGAGALAAKLKAAKLIYLSDVPGIMRDPENRDSLIPSVTRESIGTLIEQGVIQGGMIPKVQSALTALDAGVNRVHFIDGRVPHALLIEVFTTTGVGTEVTE